MRRRFVTLLAHLAWALLVVAGPLFCGAAQCGEITIGLATQKDGRLVSLEEAHEVRRSPYGGWVVATWPLNMRVDNSPILDYKNDLLESAWAAARRGEAAEELGAAEKLLKELGIKDPLGKPLEGYYIPLTIIGVVRDYVFDDFRTNILPALHHIKPTWGISQMLVRISPENISGTLSLLERTWKDIQPNKPFLYSFLDETMEAMYNEEKRWGAIVGYSSALAVIIACMGIFGLTSIAVNRRTKEIGIRKVLGASVPQIIDILIREFLWLVGIANIISWPLAYVAMKALLDNYYYRIPLGLQYFLLAGVLSLLIAMLTTLFLAFRAAVANPVDSLRYE